MHTIIAGAFAAFYFFLNTPQMPANPVAESTRRACTYSCDRRPPGLRLASMPAS